MHSLALSILAILLLAAAISDIRYQKIPNALTLPGIIAGLLIHVIFKEGGGPLAGMEGLAVGVLVMLIPFLMGLMGGGDVKLMGLVGSFLGPKGVFDAFLASAVVGGIYSVVLIFLEWRLEAFRQMAVAFGVFFRTGKSSLEGQAGPRLCYGVAIAVGTAISLVLSLRGAV